MTKTGDATESNLTFKRWCPNCQKYTYFTSAGCMDCGTVIYKTGNASDSKPSFYRVYGNNGDATKEQKS